MSHDITDTPRGSLGERLDGVDARLDAIEGKLDRLLAVGEPTRELIAEAGPILRSVSRVAVERLADYEGRGYFTFARELGRAVDGVVRAYAEEDMARFADAAVHIADTVRTLTQPEVLDLIDATGEAAHGGGEPLSMWGALRATRDPEIQQGLALVFALLRGLGRARGGGPGAGPARAEVPAAVPAAVPAGMPSVMPSGMPSAAAAAAVMPSVTMPSAAAPACATPAAPSASARRPAVEGGRFDADGFLLDPGIWTPALGDEIAAHLGVALTESHRAIIEYARADYRATGSSPNVSRVAHGAGVGVRAIYALFPRQPGKTIARIAGIPKPAGCL
ncbi:MAG: TusE/DsrC/DsvC family sulfur relay protein [bacterium]